MSTDLGQQLPRFAEAIDREAPAISVDEILSRGTVAVDVDRPEGSLAVQARRVDGVIWGDATTSQDGDGERHASIELAPTSAVIPIRRRVAVKIALAAAAAAVLVVALASIVRIGDESEPADVPSSTVPAPPTTTPTTKVVPPSTVAAVPITTVEPPTSGGMWPQSTLEEVRAAQELADTGDPDYTWQIIGTQPTESDPWAHFDELELVDRFLGEVLGWESYIFNSWEDGDFTDNWVDGVLTDQRFLLCAPGRTNPLYPPGSEPQRGELCAPTLDDFRYESVSVDLAPLVRQGADGIWVVNRWERTAPFTQTDPAEFEAQATERLEEFLAARIAGEGAEGHVQVYRDATERLEEFLAARTAGEGAEGGVQAGRDADIPLLYATTPGAPYERYEIDRVGRPQWPDGSMTFSARLFADGDATVVEQKIHWGGGELVLFAIETTENGQPVGVSTTSADGQVSVSAPSTWDAWLPGEQFDVWFGGLWHPEDGFGNGERIEFTDPVAYDAWCAKQGGSPLLSAPADAAAIAQQVIADPNFETTAPVAARIGGLEAVAIDVALAPGGRSCGVSMIEISRWIHGLWEPGWRLRLYLVDLPEGMSVPTLAITVVAPEDRFDDVIAETAPIIESIEFHPPAP